MTTERERFRGALLGLACGDALGTTVEFRARGTFAPVDDMVGGGTFRLRAGDSTDDTSMALCLARSLVETGGFEPRDQMQRYVRWWREGYLASNGRCFDIDTATRAALARQRFDRIARHQPDQEERQQGHADEGRHHKAEAGQYEAPHRGMPTACLDAADPRKPVDRAWLSIDASSLQESSQ